MTQDTSVPEEKRTEYITSTSKAGGEITASGLLKVRPHAEKRKNRNEPVDDFEDVRRAALKMLAIGYREMQKTEANHSLLDSAKTWAQCKLEDRDAAECADRLQAVAS